MAQFIDAEKAAELFHDGMSVGICGFGGWLGADIIFHAIARRYERTGRPRNLSVFSGILPGDLTTGSRGMNILAMDGLISEVRAAHVGMALSFGKMIAENRMRAFALPLGLVTDLLHAAASGKPAVISPVGLGSFCDPRVEGGALNNLAARSGGKVAELTELDGKEYLLYRTPTLDACIMRIGTADSDGNLSARYDPMTAEQLEMALAVKACGGIVIAQVDRLAEGKLSPRDILLHNSLVDFIVLDLDGQCTPGYDCPAFRPELCGYAIKETDAFKPMPLNNRKICGRRAVLELQRGNVVNLGIGIPEAVAAVAAEEGIFSQLLLSVESGPLGGVPVGGPGFGAAVNPQVIYRLEDNFNFYDGGGLDMSFLGAGEIDEQGNVNVSRFGKRTTGPGGFINIVQSSPVVCFMSTFTASGLETEIVDGKLRICSEGKSRKFRKCVEQITFSSWQARKKRQKVMYITERAVFTLGDTGLVLTEIAPGVNLEKDILACMDFRPEISPELREMDKRIFQAGKML